MTSFSNGFNGYASGAAATFARLKRADVLTPSSENSEQITSFGAFFTVLRPRVTDTADSDTSLSTPYGGSRSFRRRQLRERRRSWRETFDRAWSSMWERRTDAVEKELLTRVSSRRLGRPRFVTRREAPTTNGQAIADESPTRRSSNRLVSRAGRHTDQLIAPSIIVSYDRRMCSNPLRRRVDERWGSDEGLTSVLGSAAHRSEIPIGLQHKLTLQVISIGSKLFSMFADIFFVHFFIL